MPREVWETLSPHAQAICRRIKAPPGVWLAEAGVMHPLAGKRAEAKTGVGGGGGSRGLDG
ncbi:MAG TPA: hypothetical protein VGF71_04845 [Caulobacteraceae bacterium]